jgi:cytochrome P450
MTTPAVEAERDDDWDPRSTTAVADQVGTYDQLRSRCPVAHSEYLGWSVFRHADVVGVLTDLDTFSSVVSRHPGVPSGFDPPRHTAYRRIIDPYFASDRMAKFEPACRELSAELVGAIPRDTELDFVDRVAMPFALRAQRTWLGWPLETEEALREWVVRNHEATRAGDREQLAIVAGEFDGTIRDILNSVRAGSDAGDVTTRLLGERIDGVPLEEEELISILRNWTVGELGSISASVGILANYLATHQNLQDHLRRAPEELPAAIDEILRIDPPFMASRRTATRTVTLGDRTIAAGERVSLFWAAADRDEDVFGDPDALRPEDNAAENLLYGRGIHYCPGAPLARLELRVFVEELLAGSDWISSVRHSSPRRAAYPAGGFVSLPLTLSGTSQISARE